jgi:hypothetical protein
MANNHLHSSSDVQRCRVGHSIEWRGANRPFILTRLYEVIEQAY